ncbi:MAG: DUF2437 domain-containing protein [Alphaproteobacteria bacterium]|nr:DUF2437 domain-containing protein [Alphaproteobacteria bacterium]
MKLVSFRHGGKDGFGVVKDDGIVDLTAAFFFDTRYVDLRQAFAADTLAELERTARSSEADLGLTDVSFLLPIPRPGKIFCAGGNYDSGGSAPRVRPDYPTIFTRLPDSFAAHDAPILKPKVSDQLDYEGELAVVVGRGGRHIAERDALGHVGGYTCLNEGSVRDWQTRGTQNCAGKSFYHSGSMGPWIVTADEIPDPSKLRIRTRVNGETRQDGGTGGMLFSIPFLISYISRITPLEPGDIITTGSPDASAVDLKMPKWLKAGDRVEIDIDGIGTLRNPVEAE